MGQVLPPGVRYVPITHQDIAAAVRTLRRSCPSPQARGALAGLVEAMDVSMRAGCGPPELVLQRFVEAVQLLAAAPVVEGSDSPVSGAGGPG